MPFPKIKDFEIKQPMFGANYLQGRILAEPDGMQDIFFCSDTL